MLVMIGGAVGVILRYLFGFYLMKKFPNPPIPVAMLVVNTIGSLGLGTLFGCFVSNYQTDVYEAPLYLLIGLGFFGAFTTFSTFSVETMLLLRDRLLNKAVCYVLLTITLSLLFFTIGIWLTI
jgi:fluoride exporter